MFSDPLFVFQLNLHNQCIEKWLAHGAHGAHGPMGPWAHGPMGQWAPPIFCCRRIHSIRGSSHCRSSCLIIPSSDANKM